MASDRLTIAAARPGMRVRWADNDAAPETTIRYVWPDMVQVAGHVCAYHPQNFIPADPVEQPTLAALLAERAPEFLAAVRRAAEEAEKAPLMWMAAHDLLDAIERAGLIAQEPRTTFHLTPQQFQEMHNAG